MRVNIPDRSLSGAWGGRSHLVVSNTYIPLTTPHAKEPRLKPLIISQTNRYPVAERIQQIVSAFIRVRIGNAEPEDLR